MPNNSYSLDDVSGALFDEPEALNFSNTTILYELTIAKLIKNSLEVGSTVVINHYDFSLFSKKTVKDLAIYYKGLSVSSRHVFISVNQKYRNSIYWSVFINAYNELDTPASPWGNSPSEYVFPPPANQIYVSPYPVSPAIEVDVMPAELSESFPPNHYEKIVSKFGSIKPLKIGGLYVTENDLLEELKRPCAYKAKGIAGCHDLMCRAFVYYISTHGETLSLLTEEWISASHAFIDKANNMPHVTAMCASISQDSCNKCGEYSSKQVKTLLNDAIGWSCWQCYRNYVFKCNFCDETKVESIPWNAHNIVDGLEVKICIACHSQVKRCDACERAFIKKPLFNGKCEKCTPSVIKEYQWKPSPPIFHGEGDTIKDPYFGIELEVEMKQGQEHYAALIATRFQVDVGGFIYIKKDSSISSGFEIVSHPGSLKYWQTESDKLFEGLRKLTKHCESWSVDNCGIHVHVGLKSFTEYGHMARFLMFINNNRLFSAFIAERYNAKQAPFLDMSNYDIAMAQAVYNQVHDRHVAVNMQPDLPTIEVRIFKGNMRKAKILKNIEYVHAVQAYTRMQTSHSLMTVKDFIGFVAGKKEQYPNLYKYIAKYKKDI